MVLTPNVFVVDDEARICDSLKFLLEREGLNVSSATRGNEALSAIAGSKFDLFLLDIDMPEVDGFQLLEQIIKLEPDVPVVMMTGYVSIESAITALKKGAYDYLRKPFEHAELIKTVKNALEQKKLRDENRAITEKLKLSERRYRQLVQSSPDLIYTLDKEGKFNFVNEAFERLLGFACKDLIGKPYTFLVHEEDLEKAQWLFNERRTGDRAAAGIELRLKYSKDSLKFKECEVKHLIIELKSTGMYDRDVSDELKAFLGTYGVARDISYRRQLESQLRQAQKMEALGTLAGGIAHDFNNILMGIQGYASLMLMDIDANNPSYNKLMSVEHHVQSGAELTRQLLGFARTGVCNLMPTDMNRLVERTAAMFCRTKKEITTRTRFQPDLWASEVDEGQIEQVLLNLYVNAWQAMPKGGEILLETEKIVICDEACVDLGLKFGNYIKISVTDNGIGMDDAVRQRIFEPFFTTKDRVRGTGLGLACAYGIVNNHGGAIKVFSKKGEGSRFEIYLPASDKKAEEKITVPKKIVNGHETILLVDDEDHIVEVTCEMLESLGYTVMTANSGKDAIEIFKKNKDQIDLLILDMIMPGMGGGETFDIIKSLDSDVKVLLSSGYSLKGEAEKILHRGCNGFIQKPYKLDHLSEKINQIFSREHA